MMSDTEAVIRPLSLKIERMLEDLSESLREMSDAIIKEHQGAGGGWHYVATLQDIESIYRLVDEYTCDRYRITIEKMKACDEPADSVQEIMMYLSGRIAPLMKSVLGSLDKMAREIVSDNKVDGAGGWHYVRALQKINDIEIWLSKYSGRRR